MGYIIEGNMTFHKRVRWEGGCICFVYIVYIIICLNPGAFL